MNKLTSNPIFRTVGIIVILYFALFHNKQDPNSLGNRLSGDRVKENIREMSVKSVNILEGVRKAEEINQTTPKPMAPKQENITPDKNIENKPAENQSNDEQQNLNNVNNGK